VPHEGRTVPRHSDDGAPLDPAPARRGEPGGGLLATALARRPRRRQRRSRRRRLRVAGTPQNARPFGVDGPTDAGAREQADARAPGPGVTDEAEGLAT
jgi:hypothetical protein